MRLLSLDFEPVYGAETMHAFFATDTSVFDYDVVIWDPESSFNYYTRYAKQYQGHPWLSDDTSVQIQADVSRRHDEFKEFLELGRSLVIIVRPPQKCYVATGQQTFSGTGRNRVTTRVVAPFDLWSALPVADLKLLQARGDRIEIIGDGPLQDMLRAYEHLLSYAAIMGQPSGQVLAQVVGTDRAVASLHVLKSGGQLLMLPSLLMELGAEDGEAEDEDEDDDSNRWVADAPEFQSSLLAALAESSGGREITRPQWSENYQTAEQKHLQAESVKQHQLVESARKKLALTQHKLEEARARDQLFLGTGRVLELEVKVVLELLGGTVTEPDPGRDDWKVVFPEGKAVVEVKGVAKSAAEKQAAQLEKWVASELESSGTLPKGLLVVNTWRKLALNERTEQDFPDQMISYSKSRGHCLVTGLQLFVIKNEVEQNPKRAAFWRKKLLDSKGRLSGVRDWRTVIGEVKTAEDSTSTDTTQSSL